MSDLVAPFLKIGDNMGDLPVPTVLIGILQYRYLSNLGAHVFNPDLRLLINLTF
jgi:hypothetical protein